MQKYTKLKYTLKYTLRRSYTGLKVYLTIEIQLKRHIH